MIQGYVWLVKCLFEICLGIVCSLFRVGLMCILDLFNVGKVLIYDWVGVCLGWSKVYVGFTDCFLSLT